VESPLGLQRLSLHAQAAQTQKNCGQIVAELAQAPRVAEDLLKFTYQPPRTRGDLAARTSAPFSDQALIEDVLALVKGGKDANVYLCRATPQLGTPYLAAKVYRPRQFRNLRNEPADVRAGNCSPAWVSESKTATPAQIAPSATRPPTAPS
jgi:hypothetical protein